MSSFNNQVLSLATAKICRLCETKDGPFLNIFGHDMDISKKIENLLLFSINEYDDLPHKICYRCSARLEDFQEFVHKSTKTQENLCKLIGKKFTQNNPRTVKIKHSWEAKLTENRISNEEYCDVLIKKALELATGIKTDSDEKACKNHKISPCQVRIRRCDTKGYPGIEKKGGKYFLADISKIPKKIIPTKSTIKIVEQDKQKLSNGKKSTELCGSASSTNIVVKNPDSSSNSIQNVTKLPNIEQSSKSTEVADSFTVVKVAGFGLVYTCKFCDCVLLDRQKVQNHKCFNPKSVKQPSVNEQSNNISFTNKKDTQMSLLRQNNVDIEKNASQIVNVTTEPDIASIMSSNNILQFNPGHSLSNLQISNVKQLSSPGSCQYQFPTNLYLVPSGNNSFSLEAGPSLSFQNSVLIQRPPPTFAKPNTVPVVPQTIHTDNSILPDISRSSVYQPLDDLIKSCLKVKSSKKSKKKRKSPPPSPVSNFSRNPTTKEQTNKKHEPSVPYPIGLLCRNPNKESAIQRDSSSTSNPENPKYTILPPKTPGKIVISTVASKNIPVLDSRQDVQDSVPLKKRKKQVTQEPTVSEIPQGNEHFFTYINLDSVMGSPSALETIQESSVTTSVISDKAQQTAPKIASKKHWKDETTTEVPVSYACSICDLTFSREKKLIAHVRTHYEVLDDD